jgi:hypothetical protein
MLLRICCYIMLLLDFLESKFVFVGFAFCVFARYFQFVQCFDNFFFQIDLCSMDAFNLDFALHNFKTHVYKIWLVLVGELNVAQIDVYFSVQ